MTPKIRGKKDSEYFFSEKKIKLFFLHCLCLRLSSCMMTPPKRQCPPEVIHCSHLSCRECGSCEGFMLCMSSFIYLLVVFLCRRVDDVAFFYLSSAEPMLSGLVVTAGSSFF